MTVIPALPSEQSSLQSLLLRLAPYALAALFVGVPLTRDTHDQWDAAIAGAAATTGDYSGVDYMASSMGFPFELLAAFAKLQMWLAELLHTEYRTVAVTVMLIALAGVLRETRKLAESPFGLSQGWATAAACLVAVFPAWTILHSSANAQYVISLALLLFAVRRLQGGSWASQGLGMVTYVLALVGQFGLAVGPVLALTYDLNRRAQGSGFATKYWRTLVTVFLSFSFFVLMKIVWPPTREYATYNVLALPTSLGVVEQLLLNLIRFGTFFALPALAIAVTVVSLGLMRHSSGEPRRSPAVPRRALAASILLILASVLPYALVGKATSLPMGLGEFDLRFVVPLSVALSITTVQLVKFVYEGLGQGDASSRWVPIGSLCITGLVSATMLLVSTAAILNVDSFEQDLVTQLRPLAGRVPPGTVQIVGEGAPHSLTDYEMSFLLGEALGDFDFHGRLGPEVDPTFMEVRNAAQYPPMFRANQLEEAVCETVIRFTGDGYTGDSRTATYGVILRNVLGLAEAPDLLLKEPLTTCAAREPTG